LNTIELRVHPVTPTASVSQLGDTGVISIYLLEFLMFVQCLLFMPSPAINRRRHSVFGLSVRLCWHHVLQTGCANFTQITP